MVFAPGSCSTGAAWRPIISHCEGRFRCVTTSLVAYGGTAERRTAADASIGQVATALEAVIRRAGRPAHLVGHSFGGLVALAVALRRSVPLASLSILEAPAAQLLNEVGEHAHYRAFRDTTDAYFAAFAAGRADAIATMVDFYGGAGTFAAWPARVRAYAVATTAVNMRDWASAYGFQLTPALLAGLTLPVLIIRGGASHAAVRCANELRPVLPARGIGEHRRGGSFHDHQPRSRGCRASEPAHRPGRRRPIRPALAGKVGPINRRRGRAPDRAWRRARAA